ncbi:MAG: hypothetical protein ABI411_09035 [Tahibacter sp.]
MSAFGRSTRSRAGSAQDGARDGRARYAAGTPSPGQTSKSKPRNPQDHASTKTDKKPHAQ